MTGNVIKIIKAIGEFTPKFLSLYIGVSSGGKSYLTFGIKSFLKLPGRTSLRITKYASEKTFSFNFFLKSSLSL